MNVSFNKYHHPPFSPECSLSCTIISLAIPAIFIWRSYLSLNPIYYYRWAVFKQANGIWLIYNIESKSCACMHCKKCSRQRHSNMKGCLMSAKWRQLEWCAKMRSRRWWLMTHILKVILIFWKIISQCKQKCLSTISSFFNFSFKRQRNIFFFIVPYKKK